MLSIPFSMNVSASKPFTARTNGKNYVKLSGTVLGLGLCEIVVPEEKIPDQLEGKTINAEFELYVGRDFSIKLGFKGVTGYAS